jgi:hypothetical protein
VRALFPLAALLTLAACAGAPKDSAGFLTSYEGLKTREDTVRAAIRVKSEDEALKSVLAVRIEPTVLAPLTEAAWSWMTLAERALVTREADAQLCFELSERYDILAEDAAATQGEARVRAAIVAVQPTGRVGSLAAAAASFFIPGPLGVRAPGTLGGLAAEAEMLKDGAQVAAVTWSRSAKAVGTDNPSLSRVGDALQFIEPFADSAAAAMTPKEMKRKNRADDPPDPCARFGRRFRPEGIAARIGTGLYVPELSGARSGDKPSTEPKPR